MRQLNGATTAKLRPCTDELPTHKKRIKLMTATNKNTQTSFKEKERHGSSKQEGEPVKET